MRYLKYEVADVVNGKGLRCVIWLSGCSHNCYKCFAPHTHNPRSGVLVETRFETQLLKDLAKPFITGITISGGDTFHKANYEDVLLLLKRIKKELPTKDVWAYTGYTLEELQQDNLRKRLLPYIDTLCEGRYVEEEKDPTLPWTGSRNQRVINLQEVLYGD